MGFFSDLWSKLTGGGAPSAPAADQTTPAQTETTPNVTSAASMPTATPPADGMDMVGKTSDVTASQVETPTPAQPAMPSQQPMETPAADNTTNPATPKQ